MGDKGGQRFSKARGAWKCEAPSVVSLLLCMHDCSQRLNYRLLTLKTEKFKLWLKNALLPFCFIEIKMAKQMRD